MDVLEQLRKLQQQRKWSDYKIAQEAVLSQGTVSNIFKRNTVPQIDTLEAICKGFGITLAQFFAGEYNIIELTPEYQELLSNWIKMSDDNKSLILTLIKQLH